MSDDIAQRRAQVAAARRQFEALCAALSATPKQHHRADRALRRQQRKDRAERRVMLATLRAQEQLQEDMH